MGEDRRRLSTPGRAAIGLVAGLLVGLVAIVIITGNDEPTADRDPTSLTVALRRDGPCDDLDEAALDDALGGRATLTVDGPERCRAGREGTALTVDVEQVADEADRVDLDAVERSSGADAGSLEPWPEEDVPDLGDAATWIADPATDGSTGELYVLVSGRLVRIAVSAPPGYRRDARSIAVAMAAPVTTRL